MRQAWKWITITLLAAAVVTLIVLLAIGSGNVESSSSSVLTTDLWQSFLKHYWLSEGRTVTDPNMSLTTSEGQSYTMLRAVWENDPKVFASTWGWTKNNLQLPDKLFAWQWGRNPNGTYGIMRADNGQNTAADADSDIALALIMAAHRWNKRSYLDQATAIVKSIWNTEVVQINGLYYLAADNLEKTASTPYIVVNPSYFSPYAYRAFAAIDPTDNWNALASDSYKEIETISAAKLGSSQSDGLPPDWVIINRSTGQASASPNKSLTTNFGFNAFRTIWRLALDYKWNHTPAALATLRKFSFLYSQWQSNRKLYAIYNHSGQPAANYSSYALYGGTLAYFQLIHPSTVSAILHSEIIKPLYNQENGSLKQTLDYYDNSWVWFGLMLQYNRLPNLVKGG